ncbi:MAG: hypothetical protein GY816_20710 [Cytophagales bacterium]|nr:hypothetical protein [Cytophagales bacterium]
MRKGTSAKIWDESFKWGNGGSTQYQIVDFDWQKMDDWFKEVGNLD